MLSRPYSTSWSVAVRHTLQHDRLLQQAPWPPRSKAKVARPWLVWQVLADKSWIKRPSNTKIDTSRAIMRTSFNVKGQGHNFTRPTNSESGSASYLPNGKAYEVQTWYTDGTRRAVGLSATSAVTSKVKGQGRKVTWRVWQVLADKSRTKHPSNTKIVRKVVHPKGNNAHQFQGQRQRSRSAGRRNVETGSASYLPKGKERPTNFKLGVQMEDEDQYRRDGPSPTRSKVKIAMSHGASDRCWPISLERKVLETSKLVRNYGCHEQ